MAFHFEERLHVATLIAIFVCILLLPAACRSCRTGVYTPLGLSGGPRSVLHPTRHPTSSLTVSTKKLYRSRALRVEQIRTATCGGPCRYTWYRRGTKKDPTKRGRRIAWVASAADGGEALLGIPSA